MKPRTPRTSSAKKNAADVGRALVFPSELGWMSLAIDNDIVRQLSFGHATPQEALLSLSGAIELGNDAAESHPLVRRLQAYAEGVEDDFLDVEIDCSDPTAFQARVVAICRRIPFGSSLTYGELAARAGHPRAARAVGNCMRSNRVPLIVPCHRVVGAGRVMRGYSAGEAVRMKLRRLEMEAAASPIGRSRKGTKREARHGNREITPLLPR